MVKVKDVMRRAVYTVDENLSLSAVAKIMTNNRVGSVIIMKDGKPTGIVTDSDIVRTIANGKDPEKVLVKGLKQSRFITTTPDEDLMKLVRKMVKNGVKRIPVLQDGNLAGIVSDKEILLTTPEMIEVLSEKMKVRVGSVIQQPKAMLSGLCESCEGYSDRLKYVDDKWLCEDCRG